MAKKKQSIRDKILNTPLKTKKIIVKEWADKEWDGSIIITEMTGADRDQLEARWDSEKARSVTYKHVRAWIAVQTCMKKDGTPIFTPEDVELLAEKSGSALDLIMDTAQKISGMKAEDLDELVKNSDSGQSDENGSN